MSHAQWEAGDQRLRRRDHPRCGARTRAGGIYPVRAEPGKARCSARSEQSCPKASAGPGARSPAHTRAYCSENNVLPQRRRFEGTHLREAKAGDQGPGARLG